MLHKRIANMPLERYYVLRLAFAIVFTLVISLLSFTGIAVKVPLKSLILLETFIPNGSFAPIFTSVLSVASTVVYVYLFSDFVARGMQQSASHTFIRSASRATWLTHRLSYLFAYTACFAVFKTFPILLMDNWVHFLSSALSNTLIHFLCLVLISQLSMYMFEAGAFVLIMFGHITCLCILSSLPVHGFEIVWLVLPSAQAVAYGALLSGLPALEWMSIINWWPVIYLTILTCFTVLIFIKQIQSFDLV
ncbi:hypothetical protein KPC83_03365 [Collinsella sp. zg1085]|uniref:hypothetical protein n=1 Tax=Collinsella sp. zg1085 TaxID=2844380 RepID=UPI001C0CDDAD|nr:hypothetical protein [Collinsella sp. zg1085]QWT18182.1 hypothetical protein KPC83_03365 [Collinsella sp. zg1085]